jgi:iron complex outermembrane receptor protein
MNILFFLLWLFLDEALATESSTDSDTVNLLDAVTVFGQKPQSSMDVSTALKVEKLEFQKKLVNDTAEIFQDIPGVHLNTGGGISALPAIHG